MRLRLLLVCLSMLGTGLTNTAMGQSCEPTVQRNAKLIQGEISGKNIFRQNVNNSWIFSLEPARYGWDIRLRDAKDMDLSQITPPFRGLPNPRQVYGWHFRNADNTGKNTGDVNAPQHLRLFHFSQSLTGTGGFRPPSDASGLKQENSNDGRGAFTILDMGLTDLEAGQKARLTYLKFHTCLTWPMTQEAVIEQQNAESPVFLDEERESLYGCGLDPNKYELSAWIMPRIMGGDMDGDGAIDELAPIIRKSDGRRGLAICRAGIWMSLVGYSLSSQEPMRTKDGEPRGETYSNLTQYLEQSEYWNMERTDKGTDRLVLGRIEKAKVAIYWTGTKFAHELLWVMVEP